MAYYNRLALLKYTLTTISKSQFTDLEIVIVDDYSNKENQLDTIPNEFPSLNFNIIKMSSLNDVKTYINPCVPYNMGFKASKGDKILIQNPECCHMGDVLQYVDDNVTDSNYLSFHCYATDKHDLSALHQGESIVDVDIPITKGRWYNHKTIRPVGYHFAAAISRNNLKKLNGFDERMATGRNYDDDEFVQRVKFLNLNIEFVQTPFVIHQHHGKSFNNPLNPEITTDNKQVFDLIASSNDYRAPNKENIQ